VTFTATISSGPTGTITFYDSGTSIGTGTISGTTATFTTTTLAVGTHAITAGWAGNTNYSAVKSSAITQTVSKVTPTLSVASSSTPSTYGGSVTFTAAISSGPTGTVTFYDSGTSIGTGTISGTTETLTTTSLSGGSHSITAVWAGNTNYSAVTSSAITHMVSQAVAVTPFSVTLAQGQMQQFSAAVSGTSNQAVNWTISSSGTDTISATGFYTAPVSITAQQTVTVTATSQVNSTTGTATVTLTPIWPVGGPPGTVVTITGIGFGSAEGASSVTVGGLSAVTLFWSDTQIQAQIPTGTGTGPQSVVVTVAGQAITNVAFTVTPGLVGITPPPTGVTASVTMDTPNQTAPLIFYGTAGQCKRPKSPSGPAVVRR
jgi:hypothetical protein